MIGARFELKLNGNKKYEFSFKVIDTYLLASKLELYLAFSTGAWKRKGNILTLWDTNLEHQFYGLIRKDGIDLLFFRWIDDMVFIKR